MHLRKSSAKFLQFSYDQGVNHASACSLNPDRDNLEHHKTIHSASPDLYELNLPRAELYFSLSCDLYLWFSALLFGSSVCGHAWSFFFFMVHSMNVWPVSANMMLVGVSLWDYQDCLHYFVTDFLELVFYPFVAAPSFWPIGNYWYYCSINQLQRGLSFHAFGYIVTCVDLGLFYVGFCVVRPMRCCMNGVIVAQWNALKRSRLVHTWETERVQH